MSGDLTPYAELVTHSNQIRQDSIHPDALLLVYPTLAGWSPISVRFNWDVPSTSDSTDMPLALGVDSSATYEICDKD